MTAPSVDRSTVKAGQRASWDAISPGWEKQMAVFERGAAAMTARLLDVAGIGPGQVVLDVATGLGEPALTAAEAVGPAGRVVGADISPAMLTVARRRAAERDLLVEFVEADVESIDLPLGSFDAVLSRWGLMFAFDHVAALRGLRRLLRPGGVLAAAVWAEPARAPMVGLGYRVLVDRLDLPPQPPGLPDPYSMSDPAALAGEAAAAGFTNVSVEEFVVPFHLVDPEEYSAFNRAVSPPPLLARITERYGSADAPELWDAIGDAVRPYETDDGIDLPSTALILRAAAPVDAAPVDAAPEDEETLR